MMIYRHTTIIMMIGTQQYDDIGTQQYDDRHTTV